RFVFSPFGWESINPEFFTPTGSTNVIALKNRRAEMMHNVGDFLRTGRIIGIIRDVNGSLPLAKVFVRAINVRAGGLAATTGTLNDGSYTLDGLDPVGLYLIDALKAGYITQHLQENAFHGGYQSRLDIFLTQASPGAVSGKVTTLANAAPVPGAIVQATDISDP